MKRRRVGIAFVLLELVAALAGADLRLTRSAGGQWSLVDLPPILADDAVRSQLTSGLTTTFALTLESKRRVLGASKVEIRYELWDERFEVSSLGMDELEHEDGLESEAALLAWWGDLSLAITDDAQLEGAAGSLRVVLRVVPFSRAEQDDTQRWFSGSVHRDGRGEDTPRLAGSDPLSRILGLWLATSIQRRPLTTYSWPIAVPVAAAAEIP